MKEYSFEEPKMTTSSESTRSTTFAARCVKVSRAIHWVTVALVIGLLVTALFVGIDPHGPGNSGFLWHSSLGITLYVLSISRVLLWLLYRPMAKPADAAGMRESGSRGLRITFYALLIALPLSGWLLASEEGMSAHLFGIPALPQWYYHDVAQPLVPSRSNYPHATTSHDALVVIYLIRIHAALAVALSVVVVMHVLTVIRDRARRRDQWRLNS